MFPAERGPEPDDLADGNERLGVTPAPARVKSLLGSGAESG